MTQQTSANYGSGNACGLQFNGGDSSLTDTMVTTTTASTPAGTAATVQFYLECNSASTSEGWAFQVNAGSGWVTVVSETDDKHSWQVYNETLTSGELSSSMPMRFEFEGNGSTDIVYLDDITVDTTFGTTTVIPMVNNGQYDDRCGRQRVRGKDPRRAHRNPGLLPHHRHRQHRPGFRRSGRRRPTTTTIRSA